MDITDDDTFGGNLEKRKILSQELGLWDIPTKWFKQQQDTSIYDYGQFANYLAREFKRWARPCLNIRNGDYSDYENNEH